MVGLLVAKLVAFFLIMAAGFALVKSKILAPQDIRGLARITLYLVIPCVTLRAFQVEMTSAVGKGLLLSFAAAVVIHILLIASIAPMRKFLHFNEVEILSVIYPNAGNLTVPLVAATLGWEYVIYTSCFLTVQQFLLWSHGRMLMQSEKAWDWKKIFFNVNILAVLAGIVVLVTQVRFPEAVKDAVCSVADMVGPVTMLIGGILLGSTHLNDLKRYRKWWQVVVLRLVVVPLVAVAVIRLSGAANLIADGTNILTVTLFAILTPPATTLTLMAEVYHKDAIYANLLNVASTVLFLVTMPFVTALYLG